MKISTFLLMGVISVGMLATETAFSYPNATEWGNAYQNSDLLALKINLGNACVTNNRKYGKTPKQINIYSRAPIIGVGTVVAPLTFNPKDTTVGMHVVPYVIVNSSTYGKLPLYLIPEVQNVSQQNPFDEFLSTCAKNYNKQLAPKYLKYYPLALLHVDSQANRKKLEKRLKGKKWAAFFWYQSATQNSVGTLRDLLRLVFEKKQADFLGGLPFDVQVELIDERLGANNPLKFCVGSSNCQFSKPAQVARNTPTTTIYSTPTNNGEKNCNNEALNTQIASAKQEIDRLGKKLQEKSGEVSNLNTQLETAQLNRNKAESERSTCQRQLNSYQQASRGTESEMALLKQQLELAKSQLGSCQHSLQEKLGAATQQLEALTQENQKLNAHLTQFQQKWAEVEARLGDVQQPPGNHRLIIVSLSKQFAQGRNRQDNVIRESLIEAFSDFKRTGKRVPFTLLTIQAGRLLNESLLTAENVRRLPVNGKNSIRSQVEDGLQFGATDLRPLDDLGLVDTLIYEKKVGHVLYLTDNTRMNDKPPNRQRGIPLAWHQDGIRLQVLTNKSNGCTVWEKRLGADDCTEWQGKASLTKALTKFLQ